MTKKLILTVAVFFLFCIMGYAQDADSENPQQFEGFNLQGYSDGGKKAWDVEGDTADISGDTINLTNVDANVYGDDPMNVKAQKGSIDKQSGKMRLKDDVVVTTESGAQLLTDTLEWERKNDLVTTDDYVVITQEGLTATGTGARAHPGLKTAQLNEDVTVNIEESKKASSGPMKPGEKVTITCDGPMEIDQQKQVAVFNKNVVAVQTGRELRADKMEVYFDQETQKIKKMISIGNVMIAQGENKSFSERAVFLADAQKLTLSGRPKLILFTEGENAISSFGE